MSQLNGLIGLWPARSSRRLKKLCHYTLLLRRHSTMIFSDPFGLACFCGTAFYAETAAASLCRDSCSKLLDFQHRLLQATAAESKHTHTTQVCKPLGLLLQHMPVLEHLHLVWTNISIQLKLGPCWLRFVLRTLPTSLSISFPIASRFFKKPGVSERVVLCHVLHLVCGKKSPFFHLIPCFESFLEASWSTFRKCLAPFEFFGRFQGQHHCTPWISTPQSILQWFRNRCLLVASGIDTPDANHFSFRKRVVNFTDYVVVVIQQVLLSTRST